MATPPVKPELVVAAGVARRWRPIHAAFRRFLFHRLHFRVGQDQMLRIFLGPLEGRNGGIGPDAFKIGMTVSCTRRRPGLSSQCLGSTRRLAKYRGGREGGSRQRRQDSRAHQKISGGQAGGLPQDSLFLGFLIRIAFVGVVRTKEQLPPIGERDVAPICPERAVFGLVAIDHNIGANGQ